MTAALMLLPLILVVLDEILIRQRHSALGAGVLLGLLVFGQFFLSTELLAITAMVVRRLARGPGGRRARHRPGCAARGAPRTPRPGLGVGLGLGAALLVWPVWFALDGPAHLSGLVWPNVSIIGGFIPSSFVAAGLPEPARRLPRARRLRGGAPGLGGVSRLELPGRHGGRAGGVLARPPPLVLRVPARRCARLCSLGIRRGQWEPARLFDHIPVLRERDRAALHGRSGSWPPP